MSDAALQSNLCALASRRLEGSLQTMTALRGMIDPIAEAMTMVVECLKRGGTVYTCGNGGSAAEAQHLAEELIGRYRDDRPSCRAICLNADSAALTCIANDFGFDQVFARQCQALLTEDDLLVVLSTSGDSSNVIEALRVAERASCRSLGLLGGRGGRAARRCSTPLLVPGDDSAHIQEAHLVVIHLICEAVEQAMSR